MLTIIRMDPEIIVSIINNYIKFYKNEIQDVNIFDGVDVNDPTATNIQLNILRNAMNKYKNENDDIRNVIMYTTTDKLKRFVICKNSKPYCSSDLLFSVLIEVSNLEQEDKTNQFIIKLKKNLIS